MSEKEKVNILSGQDDKKIRDRLHKSTGIGTILGVDGKPIINSKYKQIAEDAVSEFFQKNSRQVQDWLTEFGMQGLPIKFDPKSGTAVWDDEAERRFRDIQKRRSEFF